MVARQKIHVRMIHAGETATVTCENNHFRVVIDGETAAVVPHTTTSEIHRHKANATQAKAVAPCPERSSTPPTRPNSHRRCNSSACAASWSGGCQPIVSVTACRTWPGSVLVV
jgi:hypothetical protein